MIPIFNIDALEDTVVLHISREKLIVLHIAAPKFDRIFWVLIENTFIKLQERVLQNISSTAENRYQEFIDSDPELAAGCHKPKSLHISESLLSSKPAA